MSRRTVDWLHTVIGHRQNRNIDFLTIHPRTRKTPSKTPINADSLSVLLSTFGSTLPILLSGDVFDLSALPVLKPSTPPAQSDTFTTITTTAATASPTTSTDGTPAQQQPPTNSPSPSTTHLAGFMSARGLQANPALFAGHPRCPWSAVESFVRNLATAPLPLKLVLAHLNDMCGPGMGADKAALLTRKERTVMATLGSFCDVVDFLDQKIEEKTGQPGLRRQI